MSKKLETQPVELDEPRSRLWRLFRTTCVVATEQIEQDLEAEGLPPLIWYSVLWTLERAPNHEMRLHELAQEVFLSRSNITRLIDRLEDAGLLCRKRCPNDRRGQYATLTSEGLAMRQQMWAIYAQGVARYFTDHLDDDEVQLLDQVFDRVLTKVQTLAQAETIVN